MLVSRTFFSPFMPVIKQKAISSGHCSTQLWSQHSFLQYTNNSNNTLHWRGVFHLCRPPECHNKAWERLTDAWRAAGRLCSREKLKHVHHQNTKRCANESLVGGGMLGGVFPVSVTELLMITLSSRRLVFGMYETTRTFTTQILPLWTTESVLCSLKTFPKYFFTDFKLVQT